MAKSATGRFAERAMSAVAGRGMTFAEFGTKFIDLVVTADRIRQQLAQAVPATNPIDQSDPLHIWGQATAVIGSTKLLQSGDAARERKFETPLILNLTLYIDEKIGQENYELSAKFALHINIQAMEPLTLKVTVTALKPADIDLVAEGKGNWFDLAKNFGGLEGKVKDSICTLINDKIKAQDLSINILDLVAKATSDDANGGSAASPSAKQPAKAQDPSLKGVTILKRGADPAVSTLGPDHKMRVAFPPGDKNDFDVVVYARKTSKKDDDGEIDIRVVDANGGKLSAWGLAVFASGEDWDRSTETVSSLVLDDASQAFVQITNIRADQGKSPTLDIKVQAT